MMVHNKTLGILQHLDLFAKVDEIAERRGRSTSAGKAEAPSQPQNLTNESTPHVTPR